MQNFNDPNEAVRSLTRTRFVFHAYQDLLAADADGMMWNLDAKRLDVDNAEKSGSIYLKRLRLLPVGATQKSIINNKEGFSVSNSFVGAQDKDGKPVGYGSGMQSSRISNVKGEWVAPEQKITEMIYTYGRYGLVAINTLSAQSEDEEQICNDIFKAVMSGIPRHALLEDLPEYFAEDFFFSELLPDKRPFNFPFGNVYNFIDRVCDGGIKIDADEKKPKIVLAAAYYEKAIGLAREIEQSILQAHRAALDPETAGVLPTAKELMAKKQILSYDKCAQWFMKQFPSFPMDSEVEKANKQIMRALEANGGGEAPADYSNANGNFIPMELYLEEKRRNDALSERFAAMEAKMEMFAVSPTTDVVDAPANANAPSETVEQAANAAPTITEPTITEPIAPVPPIEQKTNQQRRNR